MINFFKKNIFLLVLYGIIILAIILRFYQLGVNPPSLDWDEVSIGYNAYSILKTGADEYGNKMPLSFRSFDDYKPPVYIYLTLPVVAVFGLTEFAVRLPAAIIGVIAVITVYFFVLEILHSWNERTKQWIALFSAFFFAISPWHLQFSRAAFEGNIGVCFLTLSVLFFFKGIRKGRYHFLFAIFFVLSIYSYHSFRLISPLLLFALFVFFYKELLRKKMTFAISILFIILACLPVYINVNNSQGAGARLSMVTAFSDPSLQELSAQQVMQAKKDHDIAKEILYNRRLIFVPEIIKGYFSHFNFDFLFLHGDGGVQHHAYNMGMLYLWDLLFIITGIIFLFKKRNKRIYILFIIFLLAPLPAAFTTGTPHPVRAIAMIPAFQIFAAAGFFWCFLYFQKKGIIGKISIAVIIFMLFINLTYYLHSYYIQTPIHYGYFWQYGNKQAILYARQHAKEYTHIIMTYAYDQPYIYYLFYNKIDPVWYQQNWNYSGNGSIDRFYRKIGKYEFTNIMPIHITLKKTLLIGTPAELTAGIGQTKEVILFPDGKVAYKIVAL